MAWVIAGVAVLIAFYIYASSKTLAADCERLERENINLRLQVELLQRGEDD